MKKYFFGLLLFLIVPISILAFDNRAPEIKILTPELESKKTFTAFDNLNQNGGSIAVGDLGFDGKAEIVIGSGPGEEPWVFVYAANGKFKRKFLAYDVNSKMGVNVAIGNVRGLRNNKKRARNEIITAPMLGGSPHVRIFTAKGEPLYYDSNFFAFAENFKGGVNIASCDVSGNNRDEIIVSAGPGGASHVRVFNGRAKYLGLDYRPFANNDKGGATVACANVDGGKESEIVIGMQSFGQTWVKVYKTNSTKEILGEFLPYGEGFFGGVQVAGGDIDNDGKDEIITAPTQGGGPHIKIFEGYGKAINLDAMAYEDDYRGGIKLATGSLYKKRTSKQRSILSVDQNEQIITLPANNELEGKNNLFKYIDVNLTEQKLRAYYNGKIEHEFYISSGKGGFETPTGEFTIYYKSPSMTMSGFYGEDHPDNYELENVPHVLAFYGDYTIHAAYWHNNFGHVMSHGCVNEPLYEAGVLYDWANLGDAVIVHY